MTIERSRIDISPMRRHLMLAAVASVGILQCRRVGAVEAQGRARALREMQVHKVRELGLEIWVENQPAWRTELLRTSRATFIAEAPGVHHPPAVMSYASWQEERVADEVFATMARSAIARASQNFGLGVGESRALVPSHARHGILQGHEVRFSSAKGQSQMDVRIFVGQATGRFPVVLSLYTPRGKIHHLDEHVRRAWGRLAYL